MRYRNIRRCAKLLARQRLCPKDPHQITQDAVNPLLGRARSERREAVACWFPAKMKMMDGMTITAFAISQTEKRPPISAGRLAGLGTILLLGALLATLLGGCASGGEKATVPMLDRAEAAWQAQSVQAYEITVEVSRPDDRRRSTVIVAQGEIVWGSVSYWNGAEKRWDKPTNLNKEQSFPFTVPGLFDMVRKEIENSGRADIRVKMAGEPPFPQRIILGPVLLDGQPVSGTEATVTMISFQPR